MVNGLILRFLPGSLLTPISSFFHGFKKITVNDTSNSGSKLVTFLYLLDVIFIRKQK